MIAKLDNIQDKQWNVAFIGFAELVWNSQALTKRFNVKVTDNVSLQATMFIFPVVVLASFAAKIVCLQQEQQASMLPFNSNHWDLDSCAVICNL